MKRIKISVVTPSLNQGEYLERTIRSVLGQKGDFCLEYLVIDGGSADKTLEILERYNGRLEYVSEKDNGQSDAINKGFKMATGDILAWLNSDDTYTENALKTVVDLYRTRKFRWCFGNCYNIDGNDRIIRRFVSRYKKFECRRYSYKRLLSKDFISQPAVFFTKEVYEKTGQLNPDCNYAMDYDYWLRIAPTYKPLYIDKYLANFRWHAGSKNASAYKKAAYETFLTAKRHAGENEKYSVRRHHLHYLSLIALYRFYDLLATMESK